MQNFLRISIFIVCIAVGVGLAVSLATRLPPADIIADADLDAKLFADQAPVSPENTASLPSAGINGNRTSTFPISDPLPTSATEAAMHAKTSGNVLTEPIAAVNAPYQSAITQQVQDLQNDVRDLKNQQSQSDAAALQQYRLDTLNKVNAGRAKDATANGPRNTPLEAPNNAAQNGTGIDRPAPLMGSEVLTSQSEILPPPDAPGKVVTDIHRAEGDNNLELNLRDSDLRVVLDMISEQTGLNILASPNVKGIVTATLKNVDARAALTAILRSTGFVSKSDGNFIYIGTPEDINAIDNSKERLTTRIYQPNYVKAHEVQILITPLLTPGIGKVSVCTPAEAGIPADSSGAGGDGYAGGEVLLVRDYQAVLWQVDQIMQEIDKRPRQVSIEAMIISVNLNDKYKMGIDFQLLRQHANLNLYLGSPQATLATVDPTAGGLNVGFLGSTLGAFVDALETIGDTNVIASPRLMCLNKQKAEILIGSKLGYISTTVTQTSSTQTVNFLEVGTQLRIRPFIYSDGTIRLEVHPELSTGTVQVQGNFTLPDKNVTEVTTNITCQDGATVVIGGLIREELDNTTTQIPYFGSLPWVGPFFRHKIETTNRQEIIVLITPRITCDSDNAKEGHKVNSEYLNRQSIYADKMSPLGKRHLGEKYLRLANAAWAANDAQVAFRYSNLAIHFDPMNLEATNLREEIIQANPEFDERIHKRLRSGLAPFTGPYKNYSRQGFPWQKPPEPDTRAPGVETYDPGQPGASHNVSPVTKTQGKRNGGPSASYAANPSKPNTVPPPDLRQGDFRPMDSKPTDAKLNSPKMAETNRMPPMLDNPKAIKPKSIAPASFESNAPLFPAEMPAGEPKPLDLQPMSGLPRTSKLLTPKPTEQKRIEEKLAPIVDDASLPDSDRVTKEKGTKQ